MDSATVGTCAYVGCACIFARMGGSESKDGNRIQTKLIED